MELTSRLHLAPRTVPPFPWCLIKRRCKFLFRSRPCWCVRIPKADPSVSQTIWRRYCWWIKQIWEAAVGAQQLCTNFCHSRELWASSINVTARKTSRDLSQAFKFIEFWNPLAAHKLTTLILFVARRQPIMEYLILCNASGCFTAARSSVRRGRAGKVTQEK
jgi:hypothetical protein